MDDEIAASHSRTKLTAISEASAVHTFRSLSCGSLIDDGLT
jgi:hypothetical protein